MTLTIDHDAVEPAFEQVRRQITAGVHDGSLPSGHKLATVRALAEQLALAPNTVAKAYRALESDGIIETRGRNGTFVASRETGEAAAVVYVRAAQDQGLTAEQAVRLVRKLWVS